jgi:Uma2 family endonuclease
MHAFLKDDRAITAEEFEGMPEEPAYTFELVRGRVVRSPRPATFHGVLATRVILQLGAFVEAGDRGIVVTDAGTLLAREPDTVRGPDVCFYSTERIPRSGHAKGFWGPPDLAVEITSPSNRASAIQEKVTDYLDAGVRLVWVFDPPTRSVTVYRPGGEARLLRESDSVEGDDVLPGFRLELAGFFTL